MKKRIKVLYRKNLKMTPGKLAAQACHAVLGLAPEEDIGIVVLEASDNKFFQTIDDLEKTDSRFYVVEDVGWTELEAGTVTCLAFYSHNKG
jgi:peptidyl-tRNA hydrolase